MTGKLPEPFFFRQHFFKRTSTIPNIVIIKPSALAPLTPPATCAVLLDLSFVPELSELLPTTNTHA